MLSLKNALVVETNYLVATEVEMPLTHAGFRVVVAVDLREARVAIDAMNFDIAIIDFRLQHGGPEGLVALLSANRVPYIFCTAASKQEVIESFPGARVVQKPFGQDVLMWFVDEALSRPPLEG
jgi:DNA-binding response OmpR family regulator